MLEIFFIIPNIPTLSEWKAQAFLTLVLSYSFVHYTYSSVCLNDHTGFGCDSAAVINILAHRDATQRALIQQEYRIMYSDELTNRLSSELSGHFKACNNILIEHMFYECEEIQDDNFAELLSFGI